MSTYRILGHRTCTGHEEPKAPKKARDGLQENPRSIPTTPCAAVSVSCYCWRPPGSTPSLTGTGDSRRGPDTRARADQPCAPGSSPVGARRGRSWRRTSCEGPQTPPETPPCLPRRDPPALWPRTPHLMTTPFLPGRRTPAATAASRSSPSTGLVDTPGSTSCLVFFFRKRRRENRCTSWTSSAVPRRSLRPRWLPIDDRKQNPQGNDSHSAPGQIFISLRSAGDQPRKRQTPGDGPFPAAGEWNV